MKTLLVTGAAGFIGMHVTRFLLQDGYSVVGVDNLNDYYDPGLKRDRLASVKHPNFSFCELDIANAEGLEELFRDNKFSGVVNLAAQVGIRYSLTHPRSYTQSNIEGFLNILECCRSHPVEHLVYASSSSVYGNSPNAPFSEDDRADEPVSLYAATKRANELMAHTYAELFGVKSTGLRFFTVYGPWGRPDMAPFLFTKAIFEGKPIKVFNHGKYLRDFTYVDDIVEGVVSVLKRPPEKHQVFNIGNGQPIPLLEFIKTLENVIGRKAELAMLPAQPGDVDMTHADVTRLREWTGFVPETSLQSGLARFVEWYRDYFRK